MMMLKRRPKRQDLYERILGMEAARGAARARIERELSKLYSNFFARVKELVNNPRQLKTGEATTLQSTITMIEQLTDILGESGFDDLMSNYVDDFEEMTRSALDYYRAFGAKPSLAGVSAQTLDAYVRFTEGQLRETVPAKLLAPVQSALLQVNFGNRERSDVYDQVVALEQSLSYSQAVTLVDDSFAQYQRAVLTETANALELEIYVYLGPDDAITSEQCESMLHENRHGVDGMLYKDEITIDLHENLTRDPLIGGGHPRCRHHWSPVTADYAEAQGFELRREAA